MKTSALTKISGIGEKKAEELIAAGVTKLSDLRLKRFNEMLPEEAKLHLKYKPESPIAYDTITSILALMPKYVVGVGSYRRKKPKPEDIDILTTKSIATTLRDIRAAANPPQKTKNADFFVAAPFIVCGEYSVGPAKASIIIEYREKHYKIDIFYTKPEAYAFALLHYTGSAKFNIRIRAHAKKQGYKLNQYGLFDEAGNSHPAATEAAILRKIGVTYKEPAERIS